MKRTIITAVAEAVGGGTKAHNQYCYDVLLDKGDRIYVTGGGKSNTFTVSDECAGTGEGKFTEDTPSYGITGDIEAFYNNLRFNAAGCVSVPAQSRDYDMVLVWMPSTCRTEEWILCLRIP